jgi:thiol-disulfide isomerase/thioredoxin
MNKSIIIILLFSQNLFCQTNRAIKGTSETIVNDTIVFSSGFINPIYFENSNFTTVIVGKKFNIHEKFSYPQMFNISYKSIKDKPWIEGVYFLDEKTTKIHLDNKFIKSDINNKYFKEYNTLFLSYFIENFPKENNINQMIWDSSIEFDNKERGYVNEHPDSYVALWFLILRFHLLGYSEIRFETLNSFSEKLKSEKLWKTAKIEFDNIKIKEHNKFPELNLKTIDLNHEKLTFPEAEYTLIDYWFSRCKPCLEQLPSLIEIYNKNKDKGFNVIGISVDKTENIVNYWQKRIIERGIPWKNYLDENGDIATQEKIISFPTNFLLNSNGEVIQKNISIEELDFFLKENIKK